jgi:hypothetical protein
MALFLRNTRYLWLVTFVASGFGVFAGDSIIVSKPDAELAAPKDTSPALIPNAPKDIRNLGFAQPPQPSAPYIPPPIMRTDPRKTERRTIFDEPEMFSDKTARRDGDGNIFERGKERSLAPRPMAPPSSEFSRGEEMERALSPVWDSHSGMFKSTTPRDRPRRSSPFDNAVENDRSEDGMWLGFKPDSDRDRRNEGSRLGFFNNNTKRESTRDELERRAEFDRLLNNNFSPLGPRNPVAAGNTVSPLELAKPAAPAPLPTIATPERRSLDPMQSYADQQRSWRGPSVDDLTRKVLGANSQPAASRPQAVDTRPSLMRQPTTHDFPSRPF